MQQLESIVQAHAAHDFHFGSVNRSSMRVESADAHYPNAETKCTEQSRFVRTTHDQEQWQQAHRN